MDFAGVVSTAALVNNAISSIKNARELLGSTSEPALRDQIGLAYDSLLDLKGRLLDQDEEIRALKARLAEKAKFIGPFAPDGYYYFADDDEETGDPLCPICFQATPQQISFMEPLKQYTFGHARKCKLNQEHMIYEDRERAPSSQRTRPSRFR